MELHSIKNDYVVEKRNVLNEMRAKGWTLQQLRFFSIYLSKINARDSYTRLVRFSISEFQKIMDLKRVQSKDIKPAIDGLLGKIIYAPLIKNGVEKGYTAFQLFKECSVCQDDNGVWYIEIDAHDKALPLIFDFKREYFKYPLWNVLRLRGSNQHRMYEVLKQYENLKEITITYARLRELIGIEEHEYVDKLTGKHRWNNFKTKVLDECKKNLAELTDIKYTYKAEKRGGLNKKITFTIEKNQCCSDRLIFDDFVQSHMDELEDHENAETSQYDKKMVFLAGACDNEFTTKEIIVLYDLMLARLPYGIVRDEIECYNYILHKFRYMGMRNEKEPVKNRFAYMKSLIGTE